MKIFYAVQATGNGHISRAMELIPYLQQFGTVDIFLSGNNSHLPIDMPVSYRSKGLSLHYNATGGLDYGKILRTLRPFSLQKEINELPVEKYDLVINDFEFITAAACARKKIFSIQVGHQASFQSAFTPRPAGKNRIGEWILKNYARASHYIGLHFERYDDFILPPVIKKEILTAEPADKGHITVYLPSYADQYLQRILHQSPDLNFQVFSKEVTQITGLGNICFLPVDKMLFNKSLVDCHGIVTGAGFETPSEALYLGKKIVVVPARGQYEQLCNAAALEKLGVGCLKKIDHSFNRYIETWYDANCRVKINYNDTVPQLISRLLAVKSNQNKTCFHEEQAYEGELSYL